MLIVWIILAYWLIISYFGISTNLKTFKKFESYSSQTIDPKYQSVARTDYKKWNKSRMIIGSFTMMPIKFFALGNFVIGALIFALVINITRGMLREYIIKMMFKYFNSYGKLMNSVATTIQDDFVDQKINTPIIIANHSNWFDTFYLTLRFSPVSFVAKYSIKNWPVIGPIATAMSCIFVQRQNKQARQSTANLIKQRVQDMNNKVRGKYPLIIYPEGTTSNNRSLLTFKNGAFQDLSDITAFCLRYQCQNCGLGQDQVEQVEHIAIFLSQKTKIVVKKLTFSAYSGQTVEQYRERIRNAMAQAGKFKVVNLGYRDRIKLQQIRSQIQKFKAN